MRWGKTVPMILSSIILTGCFERQPIPGDPNFAPAYPIPPVSQASTSGSLYQDSNAISLYDDQRARRVGDILTVNLVEKTKAKKSENTKTSKSTSIAVPMPTLTNAPVKEMNNNGTATDSFSGKGDSDQSNEFSGTITVSVANVMSNGYLQVRGEKWIKLNQGNEYIQLTGIVRPEDIDSNNSVDSTRVANARITYSGTGTLEENNSPGWIARFFTGALGGLFPL